MNFHGCFSVVLGILQRRIDCVLNYGKVFVVRKRDFGRKDFYESTAVLDYLREKQADWVILAGFLWLVPENMLAAYPNRIINIHPALLPAYGGKGMYGHHVHEAVVANKEPFTGITIHAVDGRYDCGTTLFQARCSVQPTDTADDVAAKIHILEKEYFPRVIESVVMNKPMPVQTEVL